MVFPARLLHAKIDGKPGPFLLRDVTGKRVDEVNREMIELLIEVGLIEGRGSNTKIKYFQRTADDEECARVFGAQAREVRVTRGRTPIEMLRNMVRDRKTTYLDRFEIRELSRDATNSRDDRKLSGRTFMAAMHVHKGMALA